MTYREFETRFVNCPRGSQRMGQFYFNMLCDVRPDIAEELRGTDLDPFYDDERFTRAAAWVEQQWNLANPGGDNAIEAGCTCPRLDNARGEGFPYGGVQSWWISGDCTLHASAALDEKVAR